MTEIIIWIILIGLAGACIVGLLFWFFCLKYFVKFTLIAVRVAVQWIVGRFKKVIEIGPNLSGAIAVFSICALLAVFFWALFN